MDAEQINSLIEWLPTSETSIPDVDFWGQDNGATFQISRHPMLVPGRLEYLSMNVWGSGTERQRLITEFSEVLGEPTTVRSVSTDGESKDTVCWLFQQMDS